MPSSPAFGACRLLLTRKSTVGFSFGLSWGRASILPSLAAAPAVVGAPGFSETD